MRREDAVIKMSEYCDRFVEINNNDAIYLANKDALGYEVKKAYINGDKNKPYVSVSLNYAKAISALYNLPVLFACISTKFDPKSTEVSDSNVIILYEDGLLEMPEVEREFIYEHELTHFRNGDLDVFRAHMGSPDYKDIVDSREVVCDNEAIKATKINMAEYKKFCKTHLEMTCKHFGFLYADIAKVFYNSKQYLDNIKYLSSI